MITLMQARNLFLATAPVAAVLLGWQWLTFAEKVLPTLLPSPGAVFGATIESLANPFFLNDLKITLFRLLSGFGIAVVVGVGLALIGASNRYVGNVLRSTVRLLAPIPKIALYPALILIFGFDNMSKIILVFVDAVFPILLATYQGILRVEPKLIWSARAMGEPPLRCLVTVALPAALPSIMTGCRVGLIISCIVVFLAEMISSTDGLGHVLIYAARNFDTVNMFVPIILISMLGLTLNILFNMLRRRLLAGH